jgi:hypothetical protein
MLTKKLHESFMAGVQKGLDRLKSEMNILKNIENNFAVKLQTGEVLQEKMFPDWEKTNEEKSRFNSLKKILMLREGGRDRK